MTDKIVYVATYGSLRRGMGNHVVNSYANAEFVGLGKTERNIDMFAYCGGFPSISLEHTENNKPIVVDVYKTTLDGLEGPYDRLEGYSPNRKGGNFYNRTKIKIKMDDGSELDAWIYHIDSVTGPLVESGDWGLFKGGENYYDKLKD
ncbi:MAG: gamma-glutamylcyclotransferase family protein [Bacteroidales bacterium]